MKKLKGFTLIELLIVIAIIGILASIVLVSLSSARERARVAEFKSVVSSIHAAATLDCDATTGDTTVAEAVDTDTIGAASVTVNCLNGAVDTTAVAAVTGVTGAGCTGATIEEGGVNYTACP